MNRFVAVVVVCLSSTGCAITAENLQRETARVIGDISPDQVRVSNIQRGAGLVVLRQPLINRRRVTDVKWEAETTKGVFSCSADDMMRRAYCSKR